MADAVLYEAAFKILTVEIADILELPPPLVIDPSDIESFWKEQGGIDDWPYVTEEELEEDAREMEESCCLRTSKARDILEGLNFVIHPTLQKLKLALERTLHVDHIDNCCLQRENALEQIETFVKETKQTKLVEHWREVKLKKSHETKPELSRQEIFETIINKHDAKYNLQTNKWLEKIKCIHLPDYSNDIIAHYNYKVRDEDKIFSDVTLKELEVEKDKDNFFTYAVVTGPFGIRFGKYTDSLEYGINHQVIIDRPEQSVIIAGEIKIHNNDVYFNFESGTFARDQHLDENPKLKQYLIKLVTELFTLDLNEKPYNIHFIDTPGIPLFPTINPKFNKNLCKNHPNHFILSPERCPSGSTGDISGEVMTNIYENMKTGTNTVCSKLEEEEKCLFVIFNVMRNILENKENKEDSWWSKFQADQNKNRTQNKPYKDVWQNAKILSKVWNPHWPKEMEEEKSPSKIIEAYIKRDGGNIPTKVREYPLVFSKSSDGHWYVVCPSFIENECGEILANWLINLEENFWDAYNRIVSRMDPMRDPWRETTAAAQAAIDDLENLKKDRDPREAKTSRKNPASVLGDTDFFRMDRGGLVFLDSWEDDGALSDYFNEMEKKCLKNVFRCLFNKKGVANLDLSGQYWQISTSPNSEEWWPTDWIRKNTSPPKIRRIPHEPFTISWSKNKDSWFLVFPLKFKDDVCFARILSVLEDDDDDEDDPSVKGEVFKLIYDRYRQLLLVHFPKEVSIEYDDWRWRSS